ncbi:MAG: hypothetical protein COB02_17055 [Candidatus Cloacimonadota bacterium]|nr:MAG: hypothetical protein COB02_17055 [Candidatus Cloacimonadota bacterium]
MVKPLVLIVEDTIENIKVLGAILKPLDCNIAIAKEGKTALSIAETKLPDLILLDVMMPGMSGFEVCEKLKENKKTKDIPVIFLTALAEVSDITKGFKLGAVDYVTKPFISEVLLARVITHLSISKDRKIIYNQKTKLQSLIHMLCHDLMNPTHAILTVLQLLKREQLENNESFELIEDSANRTKNLLIVIREFMSIEAKGLKIEKVDLFYAIKEAIESVKFRLKEKEVSVILNMKEPKYILAEEATLIHSVLVNLLTNSIKFSKAGDKIQIDCIEHDNEIECIVSDDGIGIPKTILNKLFDVDACTTRRGTSGESGTGFGMPLVKELMGRYGGDLDVESSIVKPTGTQVHLKFKRI